MGKKLITEDQVSKALEDLEIKLSSDTSEDVSKASEDDLDQPEGADLGNSAKDKMSDAAKAKKAKKALPPVDDEDDDEDDEPVEKKAPAKKAAAKKSFSEDAPEEIQTKIDVSEFLKSLVDHTGNTIESLREEVNKSAKHADARYDGISQAVEDVQKSQAKIGIVLKAICEKIGVIAAAPARVAKSDTVVKSEGAKPAARSFDSALAEEKQEKVFKSLSDNPLEAKSQISSAMCDMVRKGEAQDLDVIGFETSGHIRPEIVTKLKQVLN